MQRGDGGVLVVVRKQCFHVSFSCRANVNVSKRISLSDMEVEVMSLWSESHQPNAEIRAHDIQPTAISFPETWRMLPSLHIYLIIF